MSAAHLARTGRCGQGSRRRRSAQPSAARGPAGSAGHERRLHVARGGRRAAGPAPRWCGSAGQRLAARSAQPLPVRSPLRADRASSPAAAAGRAAPFRPARGRPVGAADLSDERPWRSDRSFRSPLPIRSAAVGTVDAKGDAAVEEALHGALTAARPLLACPSSIGHRSEALAPPGAP